MRNLLLMLALVLLTNQKARSQANRQGDKAPHIAICLAKTATSEISIQHFLSNPVLSLCTAAGEIGGFEFSWAVVTDKWPDGSHLMGPYTIKGNTVGGIPLTLLKSYAAQGSVTKMFIENVQVIAADGTLSNKLPAKFYKVTP